MTPPKKSFIESSKGEVFLITGGTITEVLLHASSISIHVIDDETTEDHLLNISPTNYCLRRGDYISWNEKFAYWRPATLLEKEIQLFILKVDLESSN